MALVPEGRETEGTEKIGEEFHTEEKNQVR